MLKPVNVNGCPPRVNCEPDRPTKPFGSGVGGVVGVGVVVAAGVGASVGIVVGPAVGLVVAATVELAAGATVGLAVGIGVAVEPLLATVNSELTTVVPDDVTRATVIECGPLATAVVSQGLAYPSDAVPAKSIGAEPSTCVAAPLMAVLSSQKLAFLMPVVGETKT